MKKKEKEAKEVETQKTQPEILEQEQAPEQEVKLESGAGAEETAKDPLTIAKEQIAALQKEKEELIEKIKFSQAELISYRMRKDEETASILKYASQDLISELIPLIDNFESALKLASKTENPEVKKYASGIELMYNSYLGILKKYGVEEINRQGQIFDSKQEQALVAENHPELEDEIVLEVLQKGYKLKDRVIRPSSVKINQK